MGTILARSSTLKGSKVWGCKWGNANQSAGTEKGKETRLDPRLGGEKGECVGIKEGTGAMLVVGQSLSTQHLPQNRPSVAAAVATAVSKILPGYRIRLKKTNTVFSLSNSHKNKQSRFTFRASQGRLVFQHQDRLCPKKCLFL